MRRFLLTTLALGLSACSAAEEGADTADGTWIGTITTEGNVTTVVNESGSVWGGTARLVEEASIGVDVGAEEYMLGDVSGIAASDEYIYVGDGSVPVIRVYDYAGRHAFDIGRGGQGPGEFERLMGIDVARDGTLFVYADRRVNIFAPTGESLDTWQFNTGFESSTAPVLTNDGVMYIRDRVSVESPAGGPTERREIMRAAGPEGPTDEVVAVPEFQFEPYSLVIEVGRGRASFPIPFGPRLSWVLAPTGAMIAGVSNAYRFEVHHPDDAITVVEKAWQPIGIEAAQVAWNRRRTIASLRRQFPEWQWNGPEIPENAPAYTNLYADGRGRVWVRRVTAIDRLDDCDPGVPDPVTDREPNCWTSTSGYDVFDADGRFLGAVQEPPQLFASPIFRGDHAIGYVEDEAGVGMVKRYRLVLPGEERD